VPVDKKSVLLSRKIRYILFYLLLVVLILSGVWIVFYWEATSRIDQTTTDRIESLETVLTKAGALSVNEFFSVNKTTLLTLAQLQKDQAGEEEKIRIAAKVIVDQYQDQPVFNIDRIDKTGNLVWGEYFNNQLFQSGTQLNDRDYFIWASQQTTSGQVYLAKPVTARTGPNQGKPVVVMATPIFNGSQFDGALLITFSLDDVINKFVKPLSGSEPNLMIVFYNDGTVFWSSQPTWEGKNLSEIARSLTNTNQTILSGAMNGQEGTLVADFLFTGSDQWVRQIGAYAPMYKDGQVWSLLIASPYDQISVLSSPLYRFQIIFFTFGILVMVFIIVYMLFAVRAAQKEGFLEGFNGRRK
jgi:hypothetical protein